MSDTQTVVLVGEEYKDSAELQIEETEAGTPRITNHDFLESNGFTQSVARKVALRDTYLDQFESMIVEPGDTGWRDDFADMDIGEKMVLS